MGDSLQPVPTGRRILILDIARGLAVFGILLVNMQFFNTPLQVIQWQVVMWPDFWNRAVLSLIDLFVAGKFIAIFSFLFGYGMIMFRDRAFEQGRRFVLTYARRLLALALFGLLHGWFIWFGDILFHYSALGFVLMLFHKCHPRTLLVWSIILLLLLPVLFMVFLAAGNTLTAPDTGPGFKDALMRETAQQVIVYGSGTYTEIQPVRVADWQASVFNHIVFYPQILGMFLLGSYFAKRRLLHDIGVHRAELRRAMLLTGIVGVTLTLLPYALHAAGRPELTELADRWDLVRQLLGSPLLGLFYITVLAALLRKGHWPTALAPLANVGRLAFTNYIMQSVLCTLIFYGYGLKLYGKVGPAAGLLLTVAIFAVQVLLSGWWLQRFQMGPLERVWRAITYWSLAPIDPRKAGVRAG